MEFFHIILILVYGFKNLVQKLKVDLMVNLLTIFSVIRCNCFVHLHATLYLKFSNSTGTLLASGSDDLNVILWNWIKKRPSLVYDSGHRGNVFQV